MWLGPRISVQDLAQEAMQTFETELAALPTEGLDEWFGVLSEALNEAVGRIQHAFRAARGHAGRPQPADLGRRTAGLALGL